MKRVFKVKPNEVEPEIRSYVKNDLYRKFRRFFNAVSEKEFSAGGGYSRRAYISVVPDIEEYIWAFLEDVIDGITPLVGATGIGKTHLLLYCLKKYYNKEDIPTNTPVIFETENKTLDIIYFNDFNVTDPYAVLDSALFFRAKIQAINSFLIDTFGISEEIVNERLFNFFEEGKKEVLFYDDAQRVFEEDLHRLSVILNLLNEKKCTITNFVFVFDDIEGLDDEKQYELTKYLLVLYENLKSRDKIPLKYNLKFLFSLRRDTYYSISRRDQINTYRVNPAIILNVAPPLSKLFARRFEVILETKPPVIGNPTTWEKARDILLSICDRVDAAYSSLLLKLNNDNVPLALDSFMSIVSNRRWTQQNENPAGSFVIVEEKYYINDANIFRVLCMDEQKVFFQTIDFKMRCILPKPGDDDTNDYYSLLMLQAFSYCRGSAKTAEISDSQLFTKNDFIRLFMSFRKKANDNSEREKQEQAIAELVEDTINYYVKIRFIKKYVDPEKEIDDSYYILPRGDLIRTLFFKTIILFTIFRDAFAWDHKRFNTECTYKLDYKTLVLEAIKYNKQLFEIERSVFQGISDNDAWQKYQRVFGNWSVAEAFSYAVSNSIRQYYQDSPPRLIAQAYQELRNDVGNTDSAVTD